MPTKDFLISCLSKEQFVPNGSFDKGSINFLAELLISFIQKVKKGQVFLVVVLDGKTLKPLSGFVRIEAEKRPRASEKSLTSAKKLA